MNSEAASGGAVKTLGWRSPSNIALIKYWGKRKGQIPQNPSLSMTLRKANTEMQLSYAPRSEKSKNDILFHYLFEGKKNAAFAQKIGRFLQTLLPDHPYLLDYQLHLSSQNTFPHSAGMASSASSMSALALCLCSLEREVQGTLQNPEEFWQKASYLARLGSGSASRSVYGGWVMWGRHEEFLQSSQEVAIPLPQLQQGEFARLQNSILVVHSGQKEVSSSEGHALMERHPFADLRYQMAHERLSILVKAMQADDWETFAQIVEGEAMMLHGLMMTSTPYFNLLRPQTLSLIEKSAAISS